MLNVIQFDTKSILSAQSQYTSLRQRIIKLKNNLVEVETSKLEIESLKLAAEIELRDLAQKMADRAAS